MNTPSDVQAAIEVLAAQGISLPDGPVRLARYGDSPELERELFDLMKRGIKRASTSLKWGYEAEGEAIPGAGDIEIAVNVQGRPEIVSRTLRVRVLPFSEVKDAHAFAEGEGDKSLEYWRRVHWQYFSNECRRIGRAPADDMPVVCEEFEVLHVACVGAAA